MYVFNPILYKLLKVMSYGYYDTFNSVGNYNSLLGSKICGIGEKHPPKVQV
jgi:hypothetical protein